MIRALAVLLALSLALPARAQDAGVPDPVPALNVPADVPADVPYATRVKKADPAPFDGMLLNPPMLGKMDAHLADVVRERDLAKAERDLWKEEAGKGGGVPVVTVLGIVVGVAVVGVAVGVIAGAYFNAQVTK